MKKLLLRSYIDLKSNLKDKKNINTASQYVLKRPLDLILCILMLIFSLPVFIVISLAILLEDGLPIFFIQERWGYRAEKFFVFKFRTMEPKAEEKYGNVQASRNDERLTKVGVIIRKYGLDELPQLINILKGEMSFVGPRPLAINEIMKGYDKEIRYEDIPGFKLRLMVLPGLTSYSTIYKPKDIDPFFKFSDDIEYIEDQSLFLDLKLIILSFLISFFGRWEKRDEKI